MDERELLSQYVSQASAGAFGQLVRDNAGLVYSSAKRQLGDAHLAEDVTQAVFMLLAKKAGSVRGSLAGWLVRTTYFASRNAAKLATRRAYHERRAAQMTSESVQIDQQPAWETYAPMLDEAMSRLKRADRDALALRYLKGMALREVGQAMGISEEAARKRVDRGLDRLRGLMAARVVVPAVAVLAVELSSRAVEAAPAGLVQAIGASAGAAAKGTMAATIAHQAGKAMVWAKLKVAALLLAGTAVAVPSVGTVIILAQANPPVPQAEAPSPAAAPAAPAAPVQLEATEQAIIAQLRREADVNVQDVVTASDDELAALRKQMGGVVVRETRVVLENGGVSIMTCASAAAASALRERLADDQDQDLLVADGKMFVQATGTPPVQLACGRALVDNAGLQFLDVLQRRGYLLTRITWYSPSRVKKIDQRLHVSAKGAQIAVGILVNNGRELEVGTVQIKVPPEVQAHWNALNWTRNLDKYRAWGNTLIDVEDNNGQPVPDVYGPPGYDELAGRISTLALNGVRIKSMQYVTGEPLDELSNQVEATVMGAITTQCVIDGRETQLRFLLGDGGHAVPVKSVAASGSAAGNLLEVGDVTVESMDTPLGDSLTAALKQALSIAAPPQIGGK